MRRVFLLGAAAILCVGVCAASLTPTGDDPASQRPVDAPAPLAEAAARITVPPGFRVSLFAGEPDVRQPIAFEFDDRGRLWVVECYSYPNWITDGKPGRDRIVILEDTDGDGRFDRRKVFWDKGTNFTGIDLGFGGVWVAATPNLIFIPDRNADDEPDGEPEIVLDGWDLSAKHNVFSTLKWGPDGWLYGCNGILSNSRVGRPGTRDDQRAPINCGVWRYHPARKIFEAVAHGTTNPWGLDFDDHGEMFITNCVIPHLFHVTPGAHFQRMFGEDFNRHAYSLMESCADHLHWGGGDWTSSRGGKGVHSEAGGGHAHAGAMIYLGDNWPDEYRDSVFTCNIHGNRVNRDVLRPAGSTYVASHAKDFLFANDEWFRGLELKYGPDGGVFLTDWSDTGECHNYDPKTIHQENGRIYKVTYGDPARAGERTDLAKRSDAELVELQLHKNDWFVRHARRLLQERADAGGDMSAVRAALWKQFDANDATTKKLRSMWALYSAGGLDDAALVRLLGCDDEYVRAWAVRLACNERRRLPAAAGANLFGKVVELAGLDSSRLVRRNLAAALQRIPDEQWRSVALPLLQRADTAEDAYLTLMLWYGIEPLVAKDVTTAASLAVRTRVPLLNRLLARRLVAKIEKTDSPRSPRPSLDATTDGLDALTRELAHVHDDATTAALLTGMREGLTGSRNVPAPVWWRMFYGDLKKPSEVRDLADIVALAFNDRQAVASLRATVMDLERSHERRVRAIEALVEYAGQDKSNAQSERQFGQVVDRVPVVVESFQRLLVIDSATRGAVLRALAAYDDVATPPLIVAFYSAFNDSERVDAISTLASRPAYAVALLDAVDAGTIPNRDISVSTARQLQAFGKPEIAEKLAKVFGTVRPTAKEKAALIEKYKSQLTADTLRQADLAQGRVVFGRTCGQCHKLFGTGGSVGPELTGSQRSNLDFVLENVLDPSAVVPREYKLTTVATKSGRLISGIIRERTGTALVVQTENDRITLAADDVEDLKESSVSMMPEGTLDKLAPNEVRDLIAYLASPSQAP